MKRAELLATQFPEAPDQARRMAALSAPTRAKFAEMDAVIRLRHRGGVELASDRVRDGEGKRLMARIRAIADDLIRAEVRTGEARATAFRARQARAMRSVWAFVGFATLGLVGALVYIWRRRAAQYRSDLAAYESAERNHAILNGTIDALLILNPSGTIETLNMAATRMLGYAPDDLLRRDVSVVSDMAPGEGSFADRIGLIDGVLRNSWLTDRQARHRDGRLIDVDIALGVMELPDGPHVIASFRDISERRRIERLKDDFISTVSHELRSPLTSIIGALRLLSGRTAGTLNDQATRLVEIAEENARRLIRLINDMLDVDRMDSGKLRLTLRQADLREVVRRGCQGNQGLAEAYRAQIRCTVPDEPMITSCDEDRLIQALTNLTSNALKVTPRGGVVDVSCIRDDSSTPRTIVRVDDQGRGVPIEFRSRIFGRFERAIDDENKAGTGLGLAIAREIVALHGGEIWFEDRPEGGTRFAFSIPVASSARISDQLAPEPRVLIVKRDTTITESLRSLLIEEGYDARIAGTIETARRVLREDGPSVVLVDHAHQAFAALHQSETLCAEHPGDGLAVMVSPDYWPAGEDPLSMLRHIGWVDKPVDPQQLGRLVRQALGCDDCRPVLLHLDDDDSALELTAEALRQDADVLRATTLGEARNLLARQTPDIAIIDVDLAGASGLELLPDLVQADGSSIPAIIYSAHDISQQLGDDVDAVILKSGTSMPHLKATIRRIIKARNDRRKST
jgi:PAS domain S-box-containing protein